MVLRVVKPSILLFRAELFCQLFTVQLLLRRALGQKRFVRALRRVGVSLFLVAFLVPFAFELLKALTGKVTPCAALETDNRAPEVRVPSTHLISTPHFLYERGRHVPHAQVHQLTLGKYHPHVRLNSFKNKQKKHMFI